MKKLNTSVLLSVMLTVGTFLFGQSNDVKTSKFYFPTEMLIEKQWGNHWRNDSTYVSFFAETMSRYPDSIELDSLINMRLQSSALFENGFYSSMLGILEEPILCNGYPTTVYRISWFLDERRDNYSPYSIRIEEDDNGGHMAYFSYRCFDKKYRYASIYHDTIVIEGKSWEELVRQVDEYDFWNNPPKLDTLIIVFGGSTCILESWKNGKYHAVFRKPSIDSKMDKVRLFMWRMTGRGKRMPTGKRRFLSHIFSFL